MQTRIVGWIGWGLAAAFLAGISAGCRHADLAAQRNQMRVDGLRRTAAGFVKDESEQGKYALPTLRTAGDELTDSVDKTKRDLRAGRKMWDNSVRRWNERQPEVQREVGEILRGKPERLEWIAIILFL